jgi:hypothetical protein
MITSARLADVTLDFADLTGPMRLRGPRSTASGYPRTPYGRRPLGAVGQTSALWAHYKPLLTAKSAGRLKVLSTQV